MGCVELALAAVDNREIGKRLPLVEPPSKVPRDDLIHRREVVDPLHLAHLELPILRSIWASVLEPHAGRNGVRPLRVRDVETHERARHPLQAKLALQLVHGIARALLRLFAGEARLLEKVPRILRREIHELTARSALRAVNLGTVERLLDDLPLLELQRNEQLARTLQRDPIRA